MLHFAVCYDFLDAMQWLFFGNETISLTSQFDNDKSKEPNSTSDHDQEYN